MQCLLTYPQLQQLRFPKCCPRHGGIAAMSRGVACCVQSQQKSSGAGFTPAKQQTPQVQSASQPAAVDAALREAQSLLESIKQGGGSPSMSSSTLGYTDHGYACDENGCVLVVQQDSTNKTEPPFTHMLSGQTWSLGLINNSGPYNSQSFATASFSPDTSVDPWTPEFDTINPMDLSNSDRGSGSDHAALVSGPSWRVLLSMADFADFVHMLGQLRMAVASLRFQGLWHAGSRERPPSRAKWEGQHLKLTAVHAHGEPGFSMHMQFMVEEDFSSAVRHISVSWPADVTAQAIAALDDTMGFRPLAVRGT